MNYYIRQGLIPENEQSAIGNGCIGDGYEIAGYEKGVSCWRALKDGDKWTICFPSEPTKYTLTDFEAILHRGYRSYGKPILLITGDEVGKGSDGEPLLKNVKVIKELDEDTEFINLD